MITTEERAYLLREMKNLLKEYDYTYTEDALNKIIDEWEHNKSHLIDAFKTHPNYVDGKFMIAFNADFERVVDTDQISSFSRYILEDVARTMRDTLPEDINEQRISDLCSYLPSKIWTFFEKLHLYAVRTISEDTAVLINNFSPNIHAHAGEKTSRVVNKICTYLGYNKHENYNREFAKYADSLSPIVIKRHTILSINPLDYLTMSFGNSWSSCHTIDKNNKRGMEHGYHGCYSSGTISYLMDKSSMVFYIVDSSYDGDEYYTQPKVNRQMYHYGNDKLIQGRLYPQDNDGASDFYKQYRVVVQEIIAKIFDVPNLWVTKHGTGEIRRHIVDEGTHYKDYREFSSCTISLLKDSDNDYDVQIGEWPICIQCGDRHEEEDCISCCPNLIRCSHCGEMIHEDDIRMIDGEYYCDDCCHYCEYCERYHIGEEYLIKGYGYVCEECFNNHFVKCDYCGEYEFRSRIIYMSDEEKHMCRRCFNKNYTMCERCRSVCPINEAHIVGFTILCDECYEKENRHD